MAKSERAEVLDTEFVSHVEADVTAALRRRPLHEGRLAGVVRAIAPWSPSLRTTLVSAVSLLVRRGSYDRELYTGAIRSLGECAEDRIAPAMCKALLSEGSGGFATLSAASFLKDPSLCAPLAKVASCRHAHIALAAEVARVARGESDGAHLAALAPMIKESHRIALCVEIFVPLARGAVLPMAIAPALAVLRDAERHLGRWLILAEIANRAGDPRPLEEARAKAKNGPSSARAAWSLVAWALTKDAPPPTTRPTVEVVARLSDRPSADRDTTFLFRLAASRTPTVKPMLEALSKTLPLADDVPTRAALFLLRDHGRSDLLEALETASRTAKRDDLRGLAIAALWDSSARSLALELAEEAVHSRSLSTATWAGMVKMANQNNIIAPIVDEPTFRRTQWGWLE